jgi:hypothetical protein
MKTTITSKTKLGVGVSNATARDRDTGRTIIVRVTEPQFVGSVGEVVKFLRNTERLNRGNVYYDVALFLDGRRIISAGGLRTDGDAQELANGIEWWDLSRGVEIVTE